MIAERAGAGSEERRKEFRFVTSQELLAQLMPHRTEFLRYVERRVKDAGVAEDLLQEALMKGVAAAAEVRSEGALLGWFYKILENAALDHHRRASTNARAMERVGQELADAVVTANDAPARTCKCVAKLKAQLKPEYAQVLDRIEVDEVAVKDFADEAGLSRSNAAVRAFRAREALREKVKATCGHCAAAGCTDCSCASN